MVSCNRCIVLSLKILLYLLAFLLYHTTDVSQYFFIETDYFVVLDLVFAKVTVCCVAHSERRKRSSVGISWCSRVELLSSILRSTVHTCVSEETWWDGRSHVWRVTLAALATANRWVTLFVTRGWASVGTSRIFRVLWNMIRWICKSHCFSLSSWKILFFVRSFTTSHISNLTSS